MTITVPEQSTAPTVPAAPTAPMPAHPTACPDWCKDRAHRMGHHFGPTATAHWGPQYRLPNPRPLNADDASVMLRAELFRYDEGARTGETVLYIQGETDVDLSADEADMFIAQAQAFVDTLRVMRRHVG